jgi:glycosyltransferase involved in cell wall biosynthesis
LKIVILVDHAQINGGQAKVAIESAKGLAGRGYQVLYFAAVGPVDEGLRAAGVDVVVLDQSDLASTRSLARYGIQWFWNATAARKLAEVLSACDPADTIVHVHGWAKALSPSIGPVLKRMKFTCVFTMHEYFIACPNGGFYDYPAEHPCHLQPMSLACITRDCDSRSYARKLLRVGRHAVLQHTGLLDCMAHVITISRLQRKILEPFLPAGLHYHELSNPIDVPPLGGKPDLARGGFVFVGRISPEKGPMLFAEAARLAGQQAIFIGDGPQSDKLKARYPEASLLGWKNPAEVRTLLRQARALVFPSVWYEGQPLTVLESLALGTPVIVSDVCAGRESVQDGVNGRWFRSNDAASLAAALEELSDDAIAQRMSRAAYDLYWANPPSLKRHLDGLAAIYKAALGTEAKPLTKPLMSAAS